LYTHKDKIAWLNGPFPAATHDSTVFRMKLKGAIEKNKRKEGMSFGSLQMMVILQLT